MSAALRVMSYNLRGLRDDTAAAAAVVCAVDPDILLAQEVPRHPGSARRIRSFARACGLRWAGRTRRASGTTILTAPRIGPAQATDHRFGGRSASRSAGGAVAAVAGAVDLHGWSAVLVEPAGPRPDGPVLMVSTHLGLSEDVRGSQVEALLAGIIELQQRHRPRAGSAGSTAGSETVAEPLRSVVIGGDLNCGPDEAAWKELAAVIPVASGEEPTYPARAPSRRIDAILASRRLAVATANTDAVNDRIPAGALVAASDHLPVWIDVVLSAGGDDRPDR